MTKLVLIVFTLACLAGCWGPEFRSGTEVDDSVPVNTTSTVTGVGGSAGAGADEVNTTGGSTTGASSSSGGSDGEPATSTTGSVVGSGGEPATSTQGTPSSSGGSGGEPATNTTGATCAPPTELPELGSRRPWDNYNETHGRLCEEGAASGTVRCPYESENSPPCAAEFELPVEIEPVSEDGLVFKVTYQATEPQEFEVLVDCGLSSAACQYTLQLETSAVYFLELAREGNGFAVKAFYRKGDDPDQATVSMALSAGYPIPMPEECSSVGNANIFVQDYWDEYVAWVRGLTWGCQ